MLDLDTGSIYYECCEKTLSNGKICFFSPERTAYFLNSYLKNNYSIIIVNTVHPCEKLQEQFLKIAHPMICFIDCVYKESKDNESLDKKPYSVFLPKGTPLTNLNLKIKEHWKNIEGKKVIFFESGSTLFLYHKPQEVFDFIHNIIIDYSKEGLVVFKFLSYSIDNQTERQLKYFFDIIIKE